MVPAYVPSQFSDCGFCAGGNGCTTLLSLGGLWGIVIGRSQPSETTGLEASGRQRPCLLHPSIPCPAQGGHMHFTATDTKRLSWLSKWPHFCPCPSRLPILIQAIALPTALSSWLRLQDKAREPGSPPVPDSLPHTNPVGPCQSPCLSWDLPPGWLGTGTSAPGLCLAKAAWQPHFHHSYVCPTSDRQRGHFHFKHVIKFNI